MLTVLIKSWKADSTLFDGDLMDGPVPSLTSQTHPLIVLSSYIKYCSMSLFDQN